MQPVLRDAELQNLRTNPHLCEVCLIMRLKQTGAGPHGKVNIMELHVAAPAVNIMFNSHTY